MNLSLTGSFAPLKRGLIWKVSSKKVPCKSIKSIFIADKRCHDYLYTCSTFMCFFITLLAVTILNHSGAMSQTSFDHNLKRETLVKVDIDVKFTDLSLVESSVAWKRLWSYQIVLFLLTICCAVISIISRHRSQAAMVFTPWSEYHCLKPKAWILWIVQHYFATRQPCLCWSWGHWRALDGQILCFSGKSCSPGGEWGTLGDPRSRQDAE